MPFSFISSCLNMSVIHFKQTSNVCREEEKQFLSHGLHQAPIGVPRWLSETAAAFSYPSCSLAVSHVSEGVPSSHGTSVCAVWRLTLCPLLSQHNIIGTQEAKGEESLVLNPNNNPKYVTRSGAVNSILSRVWRAPSYNSD